MAHGLVRKEIRHAEGIEGGPPPNLPYPYLEVLVTLPVRGKLGHLVVKGRKLEKLQGEFKSLKRKPLTLVMCNKQPKRQT